MAEIPIISNFQGDFVLQLVAVDEEHTMDEVAQACAYHSVHRRVKPQPGKVMRVRVQDADEPLGRDVKVKDAGLVPMETVEVFFED